VVVLGGLAAFAFVAFVFSIGTAVVPVHVQTTVLDRESQAPWRTACSRSRRYWYANSLIGVTDRDAVQQFRKLVAIEPDNARGWIGLANALYDLDRYQETVEAFEKAAKICADCLNANDRVIYKDSKRLAH
jgi:tetratricopeptide (TPR) repeat protein